MSPRFTLADLKPHQQAEAMQSLHPAKPSAAAYPFIIDLPYKTPSLNRILGKRWAGPKEKKLAKAALWRFLVLAGAFPRARERRMHVLLTFRQCRLQDPDNSTPKFLIDELRYAGLLRNDDPGSMALTLQQEKVPTRKAEGTRIVLTEMLP